MNPGDYTISIRRGNFDGDDLYEARIRELPDVAEYAKTAEEAYALAIDTIETTANLFAAKNRAMPAPTPADDEFSGRVTLRVSRSLHRLLAQGAEDEGVSLNQHIVNLLGFATGFMAGSRHLPQPGDVVRPVPAVRAR